MSRRPRPSAPTFHSAHVVAGPKQGPLPRRLVGRTLSISLALHLGVGVGLVAMSLMTLESIPPPPIVITFLAPLPPPPVLVPLREELPEPPDLPPPPKPKPKPPQAETITQPEAPPPVILRPAEPRPRPKAPLKVDTPQETIRIADAAPEVQIRDGAPPEPRGPSVGRVDAAAPLAGGGAEPEIAFLVPGEARRRSRGGELAGRGDGLPPIRGVDDTATIRRQGGDGPSGIATEGSFGGSGDASFLGRKYGVTLVEARRLGQRTSDGSRYALILPMLSEACRGLGFKGRRRGSSGGAVESVQVDEREIAIRYRDGTLHVLVPTADGLVALYVSADPQSAVDRSKVEEAERALGVLQRFMQAGTRG